jgi:hypothetical protein
MPATLTVSAGNPTAWFVRMLRRRLIASGVEVSGPAVDADDVSAERLRSELTQLGGRTYGAGQTTGRTETRPNF